MYGDVIRVRFIYRIRDERKFNGPEELKLQISKDVLRALNFFERHAVKNLLQKL
ncbi:riboflavin kinase [Escherichia coli]|nr:riboflavin kinase [Escherichia coli]